MTFTEPIIHWSALLPLLIVLGGAVLGVLIEAILPWKIRRVVQIVLSLVSLCAALVSVVWRWSVVAQTGADYAINNSYAEDLPALIGQAVLLLVSIFAVLVMAERTSTGEGAFAAQVATKPGSTEEASATRIGLAQTEVYPLTLFSVGGMMVFCAAGDLLTLFVALEVLSLPLYVLSASARRRRLLSQEAAFKYFLLGAFASAFFIFGLALIYGYAGDITYKAIFQTVSLQAGLDWMLLTGAVFVLVGLLFKLGAAPFHSWKADVYQGAPTPITGFMAATIKISGFLALMRLVYTALPGLKWDLTSLVWIIIVLTMFVGTVMGIVQGDIKRMLAFSSVAHAGFVLIGVFSFQSSALPALLFYILAYGLATVGAFGIIALVRNQDANGNPVGEANNIKQWAGLGKRKPVLAVCMAIFLLSFAGLPLTSGFIGKILVFKAGLEGGEAVLVVLAVIASAATAFFYFRLIVLMFFSEPDHNIVVMHSDYTSMVAIVVTALLTLLLGLLPEIALSLLSNLSNTAVYLL